MKIKTLSSHKNDTKPNGKWGWMIVFGVALTNMFNQSLISIFGLLFGEYLTNLGQNTFGTAFIMNLNSVTLNFSGLITGPILKKYSPRCVAIIGSVLTSSGLILSSFSTNLWQLAISYGFLVGLGLGLIYPSTFVAINSYFSTKRGRAVGFSLAGTGIGQMLMPQIVRILLDHYGYQGTTLIIAGLAMHGIVGATLFQPVEKHLIRKKSIKNNIDEQNNLLVELKEMNKSNKNTADNNTNNYDSNRKETFLLKLVKIMDLELLKDPIFISIAIGIALVYVTSLNFSMLFPYFLQSVGLTRKDASFCMSMFAAADLFSRLTLPTITDKLKISSRLIFFGGAIALICVRSILAETHERNKLIIISVIYGYCRAATIVNTSLTISEHVRTDKLPSALGLNMVIKGCFAISIGQFLGWIRDYTGSYSFCLHTQNILLAIIIIIWLPEILYKKFIKNPKTPTNNNIT